MPPPTRQFTAITDVHPGTLRYPSRCRATAYTPSANPSAPSSIPAAIVRRSGAGENDTAAVHANCSIFRSGYLVWPAARAARSYGTVVWGKPTHATMPRRNRCVSRIAVSASRHRREISRKSPQSTGKSACTNARMTR